MLNRSDELDAIKREINLIEFAVAQGYALERHASSRSSAVLSHQNGDKVICARDLDRHWIFFSVRDDQDNGTIIDFVQRRGGGSLGDVRKLLRPWLNHNSPAPSVQYLGPFPELTPITKDIFAIQVRVQCMPEALTHEYLERERRIPAEVLGHPRFAGRIHRDDRGNVIFPHWNENILCGYEIKNHRFTGFSPGGEKGLWLSNRLDKDQALVVAESTIDALSHFALKRREATRYASIGGAMNQNQPELLAHEAQELRPGSKVIIATDNDAGGDDLASEIREALEAVPVEITEDRPVERGRDWNDVLRNEITQLDK